MTEDEIAAIPEGEDRARAECEARLEALREEEAAAAKKTAKGGKTDEQPADAGPDAKEPVK